jgi:excisionase family DNA binding protein
MRRLRTAAGDRTETPNEEDDMGDVERLHDVVARDSLLLTPEETATVLRVGRTTVYALMKAGELRPVHIGRSTRISRAELERFVARLDAAPPSVARRPPARGGPRRIRAACSSSARPRRTSRESTDDLPVSEPSETLSLRATRTKG